MRVLWIIAMAMPLFASATIYQIKDAQGNIYYTDQPSDRAKPVNLDPTGIAQQEPAPSAKTPKKEEPTKEKQEGAKRYDIFQITEPANQGTIWNQPSINVSMSVTPHLFKGDKVALFLDGKKVAEGETTQFALNHPDRGQHSVQAKILGPNGEVKKETNAITIFVHYGTVNQGGR